MVNARSKKKSAEKYEKNLSINLILDRAFIAGSLDPRGCEL
jgi:hypothetical protein